MEHAFSKFVQLTRKFGIIYALKDQREKKTKKLKKNPSEAF